MNKLESEVKGYLSEVTRQKVRLTPLDVEGAPFLVKRLYKLYQLQIGTAAMTAVLLLDGDEFTPGKFLKHMGQFPNVTEDGYCIIAGKLPAYVRSRLIEKGIPFVIPWTQMYLPMLGMELRARNQKIKNEQVKIFSPSTQLVLLAWLANKFETPITPQALSNLLAYSPMTMTRALDELEAFPFAKVEREGRERYLDFDGQRPDVWREASPYLRSPVKQVERVLIHSVEFFDLTPAGFSALADMTMLAAPEHPEFAVSRELWKRMLRSGIRTIPIEEEGSCVIQVWVYDPLLLKKDGMVDPFSLNLSLRENDDERVEMALEEMMEKVWSED